LCGFGILPGLPQGTGGSNPFLQFRAVLVPGAQQL